MLYSKQYFCRGLLLVVTLFVMTSCAVLQPPAKADYTVDVVNMQFVKIKGGSFQMGSTVLPDEQPIHSVTVDDLFVGMYEVTFAQYDQYCNAVPQCELPADEGWGRATRPVINVSWHDATAYADWLSSQAGLKFRLPTEAEWEYFARASTTTKFWTGDTLPEEAANCRNCGKERIKGTMPVGKFSPNSWKLYDTVGNVSEWVVDDYQKDYTATPKDGSPASTAKPSNKVVRGGSWIERMKDSRAFSRDFFPPQTTNNYIGFRLILDANEVPAEIPPK